MGLDRDELVFMAKIAEQTEQYADMLNFMKEILILDTELTYEERQLLYLAYKNIIGPKRIALRGINSFEKKEIERKSVYLQLIRDLKMKVEDEIRGHCIEAIEFLDHNLIKDGIIPEAKIFYFKIKSDFYRYLSEFEKGDAKEIVVQNALESYTKATELAMKELKSEHPFRLRLALNFSVFYYEIMEDTQKALDFAKSTYDEISKVIKGKNEDQYKDANAILQLINDNIALWTQELNNMNEYIGSSNSSGSKHQSSEDNSEEEKLIAEEINNDEKDFDLAKIENL